MSPERNSYPKKKTLEELIVEEEEVNSTEGKIQAERHTSSINEKYEFSVFVQS